MSATTSPPEGGDGVWHPSSVPWVKQKGDAALFPSSPTPDKGTGASPAPLDCGARQPDLVWSSATMNTVEKVTSLGGDHQVASASSKTSAVPLPQWSRETAGRVDSSKSSLPDATVMQERWDKFQAVLERHKGSYDQLQSELVERQQQALVHNTELAAYQESVSSHSHQQAQQIKRLSAELTQTQEREAAAREVVATQAQRTAALETELTSLRVDFAQLNNKATETEKELRSVQHLLKLKSTHLNEVEAALAYAESAVVSMRHVMTAYDEDKQKAVESQYNAFEQYRLRLVAFYDSREEAQREEFSRSLQALHASMMETMEKREERVNADWRDAMAKLRSEYVEINDMVQHRKTAMEVDHAEAMRELEKEREAWKSQQNATAVAMEQQLRVREAALLDTFLHRERELREREQALRNTLAEQEREMLQKTRSRESEWRAAQEADRKQMNEQFDKERTRLTDGFMERLQQLSNAHLQHERDLERMHREKEREMSQRYRLSGLHTDPTEASTNKEMEYRSSQLSKDALLQRFESMEQRQNERANKLRFTLSTTDDTPKES